MVKTQKMSGGISRELVSAVVILESVTHIGVIDYEEAYYPWDSPVLSVYRMSARNAFQNPRFILKQQGTSQGIMDSYFYNR